MERASHETVTPPGPAELRKEVDVILENLEVFTASGDLKRWEEELAFIMGQLKAYGRGETAKNNPDLRGTELTYTGYRPADFDLLIELLRRLNPDINSYMNESTREVQ